MRTWIIAGLLVFGLCMPVLADDSEAVISNFAEKFPPKISQFYSLDDSEWNLLGGITLYKPKTFPIDVALLSDGYELIAGGIDINVPVTKNAMLGIGWVCGFEHIENIFEGDFGENKHGPQVAFRWRF